MIRYFAGHPTAANLVMIVIAAAGALSLPALVRETFPDYLPREIAIGVAYRGAAPSDVAQDVCARIETALLGVSDLAELRCTARQGRAEAEAEMSRGGDFTTFLDNVATEVQAVDDFPDAAEEPVIREMHQTDPVASVAVAGPMSDPALSTYAQSLRDRLLREPLIADVAVSGFSDRQLRIEAPRARLRQLGLSAADLSRRIAAQSVSRPAGEIETRERTVLLRFDDARESVQALEDLVVVAEEGGGELRLGEIARVIETFERAETRIEFNGARAAVLAVSKAKSADSLAAMAQLQSFMAAERARTPDSLTLAITQDQTSIVADRLTMLVDNALQGLVLVFLTLCLFFPLRFSGWVAAGLPVSFLGAFFLLALGGFSINMISLVGFLLAIGILMDDAIVIAENIAAHAREKESALEAAVAGVREVGPGILASFITTCAVFGPLAFLTGEIGQVLKVMPIVLLAILAVSLIEAFLILPHHLLGPIGRLQHTPPSRLRAAVDAGFERVRRDVLGRAVDACVRGRYAVLAGLVFILLGTVGYIAGGKIAFEALPELDGDVLEARLLTAEGTPFARTQALVAETRAAIDRVDERLTPKQPGGAALVENIQVRYAENASAAEQGAHVATIVVDLLSAERRTATIDDLSQMVRDELGTPPGLASLVLTQPNPGPSGRPIAVRLSGAPLDQLDAASRAIQGRLAGYAGVSDILDDMRPGKPELRLRLRAGASALGLDAAAVARQLSAGFLGRTAAEIRAHGESIEIAVRQAERSSLEDLESFSVTAPDGRQIPLDAVASLEETRGWSRIRSVDGRPSVTVQADVDPERTNAIAIVGDLRASLFPALAERYPGLRVDVEGQADNAAETGRSIRNGFLVGLIGVFVVLAFQFRNYVEPLLAMAAIPFAMLGAVWGHAIMGYNLSMPSLVGAVSLAGIVVNNAILLVHFTKARMAEGESAHAAAAQASRARFRAVTLATATTIAGLVPLLFETSLQAQVLKPLVISVGFGLLTSALLVLLALPALYAILEDARAAKRTRDGNGTSVDAV